MDYVSSYDVNIPITQLKTITVSCSGAIIIGKKSEPPSGENRHHKIDYVVHFQEEGYGHWIPGDHKGRTTEQHPTAVFVGKICPLLQ